MPRIEIHCPATGGSCMRGDCQPPRIPSCISGAKDICQKMAQRMSQVRQGIITSDQAHSFDDAEQMTLARKLGIPADKMPPFIREIFINTDFNDPTRPD